MFLDIIMLHQKMLSKINYNYQLQSFYFFRKNNYNSHYVKNSKLTDFQIFDYKNWLPNDLLVKLDRCLMTYGMEGRTPFIDKTLFQKLFYTNNKNKINKGFTKYYIREFLSRIGLFKFG